MGKVIKEKYFTKSYTLHIIWVINMKLASLCQQLGFHQKKKSRAKTFIAFHKDFNLVSFFFLLLLLFFPLD